jgi:hypothetical protein
MSKIDIDMNSTVKINGGKSLNMAEFADKFGVDLANPQLVVSTANILEKQGKLIVVETKSKEEQIVDQAMGQEVFQSVVENLDNEEQAYKEQLREAKKAESDVLKITLAFITTLDATKFNMWLTSLGVTEVSQIIKNGCIKLLIEDITPQEYTKISAKYKAEKAINATVNTTSKVMNGTTNAVNYGLSEVVAPVAKIAGEAGMNLGKGLFHTLIKTGAGLINSGAKAVTDTKIALMTDPECLRATSQLIDAKNNITRGVNKQMNNRGFGSGIEIL